MYLWIGLFLIALGVVVIALPQTRRWYSQLKQKGEQTVPQNLFDGLINAGLQVMRPWFREPLFFHYLDERRVEELHSQVEPEWIETQRKVGEHQTAGASAGIGSVVATAEASASASRSQETSSARILFSPTRKCLELMRFAVEKRNARTYETAWNWFILRMIRIMMEGTKDDAARTGTTASSSLAELSSSPERMQEINRRVRLWDRELEAELTHLNGLSFVEGQFSIAESTAESLTLVHELVGTSGNVGDPTSRFRVGRFRPVGFIVKSSRTKELTDLLANGSAELKVFGYVTRALGDDGLIQMQAVAIS